VHIRADARVRHPDLFMSHFPDVDRMEAVKSAWPRLFAEPPLGMQPLAIDDDTLIVLCQARTSSRTSLRTNASWCAAATHCWIVAWRSARYERFR